ncbi:Tryptophan--tRNA ligase 2 [compost metagenome]
MGCSACKQEIIAALDELLEPMRERRAYYATRPGTLDEILMAGTARARGIAKETMGEVREAMCLNYFG